jgi:hypothetical protein
MVGSPKTTSAVSGSSKRGDAMRESRATDPLYEFRPDGEVAGVTGRSPGTTLYRTSTSIDARLHQGNLFISLKGARSLKSLVGRKTECFETLVGIHLSYGPIGSRNAVNNHDAAIGVKLLLLLSVPEGSRLF